MILFEYTQGDEQDPDYAKLAHENGLRLHQFLTSIIYVATNTNQPFLSQTLIKAINFHAIACLHTKAGEYRPCPVSVYGPNGDVVFEPPENYRVPDMMDFFVNQINRWWDGTEAKLLAAYALWGLCSIHPFINGNGRTARAACHFVLCMKGVISPLASPTIPDLIIEDRQRYREVLQAADAEVRRNVTKGLKPVADLIDDCMARQNK